MTQVLAAGQLYQVRLFAGRRVISGSAAPPHQVKNKFHKQFKRGEWKLSFSDSEGEGWGMYLARCCTRRWRGRRSI